MHACAGCRYMLTGLSTPYRVWSRRIDMYAGLFLVCFYSVLRSGNLIFGCCGQSPWVKTMIQNDGKLVLVSANRETILTSLCTWLGIFMCCILVIV